MLEKILLSCVAGLFGLLPIIFQWLTDRRKSSSRHSQIGKLMTEIDFLERWSKLHAQHSGDAQTTTSKTSIQSDLNRILDKYQRLTQHPIHDEDDEQSFFQKALLLFKPRSFLAFFVHASFYLLSFFVFIMLMTGLFEQSIQREYYYLVIGCIVLFGPPLVFLQRTGIIMREKWEVRQTDAKVILEKEASENDEART